MGMLKYLKAAFVNQWNLLALFAGMGFGVLSGHPEVILPLVMAGEVAYVGMLGAHPRFQKYVDARDAAANRQSGSQNVARALQQILQLLPNSALSRFERLRARCYELRQIADDLRQSSAAEAGAPLENYQLAGLDKLLWIFLRLLFTQHSLTKFLEQTSVERIQADIEHLDMRLKKVSSGDAPHTVKIRRTLEDNLQTCRDRLANFEKAQANHELVSLEIDRLENKIKSLAEMAVNRQEPDFISGQVDQVATSMVETEKTMNDLQFATGLAPIDEEVPELLTSPPVQVVQ
jgi:hypothetical protein